MFLRAQKSVSSSLRHAPPCLRHLNFLLLARSSAGLMNLSHMTRRRWWSRHQVVDSHYRNGVALIEVIFSRPRIAGVHEIFRSFHFLAVLHDPQFALRNVTDHRLRHCTRLEVRFWLEDDVPELNRLESRNHRRDL